MNKASDSENFCLNQDTHRCFCLWRWASVPCSGTYSPSHGLKHWALGAVFGRVSAELEGDLCLSAVWWLWGFLAGLSPLLRGSSGLSNSSCEQSEGFPSLPSPSVCFNKYRYHTFLCTGRKAQPGMSQGLCWPLPETTPPPHKQNCSWPPP